MTTHVDNRVVTVDALRGLASFGVCWLHLTHGTFPLLPDGWLKRSGTFGWLGVEIFFVISGFIIPHALYRARYRITDYPVFLAKRIIRLDPPYLVCIALVILLGWLTGIMPDFDGESFRISFAQFLLHLGYLNVFFGYKWLNPVFWTLAIEFQYYLAVGLLFPLIKGTDMRLKVVVAVVLGTLAFLIPSLLFLPRYLFVFMMGMATFQYRNQLLSRRQYLIAVAVLGVGAYLTLGKLVAFAGAVAALLIAFVTVRFYLLHFFGEISYSLYLLHMPVAVIVARLCSPFIHSERDVIIALFLALAACVGSAYLLYRFVEKPAQGWSSALQFGLRRRPTTGGQLIDQQSL